MPIIRTHDELEGAAVQSPCAEFAEILRSWSDRLQDYDFAEVAIITLALSVQTIVEFQHQAGHQLIENNGSFWPVETATRHQNWIELVFILSDDGFGVVLLVPTDAEPALLAMCEQAMP